MDLSVTACSQQSTRRILTSGTILVDVNEHSKNALNAESDQIVSGGDLFHKSLVESSRKFWSGERPLSVIHWTGIALLYIGVGVLEYSG